EAVLRLPSLIAGLLGILAMFGVLRTIHSNTAGLAGALMVAVSPFHISHSQHARYYTLLMLFATLTLWMCYLAVTRRRWPWYAAYAGSGFLAMISHVCFAPAFGMMNVGAALYLAFAPRGGTAWQRMRAIA